MINLGLIGAGRWGRNYIKTVNLLPNMRLAAVASRNLETRSLVKPQTKVFTHWEPMMELQLDGLILAVPPTIQPTIALHAIEANLPLLLEKPMALDVASAKAIADAAIRQNVYVMVNHIYLHHSAYLQLKQILADKGEPITAIHTHSGNNGPFRSEWSALWDWGPHDVAMALDLMDTQASMGKAEKIAGSGGSSDAGNFSFALNQVVGASANLTFGNLMPRRKRQLEVCTSSCEYKFNDEANDSLTLRSSNEETSLPVPEGRALDNSICTFAKQLQQSKSDDADSSLLQSVAVIELLAQAEAMIEG